MALMADLSKANEILHRNQPMMVEYGTSRLLARLSAKRQKKVVHSRAIPPAVDSTKGVKTPRSTSLILALYSLFLAFSCC